MRNFEDFNWEGITYPQAYLRSLFDFVAEHPFKKGLEIGFDQGASALAFLRGDPQGDLLSVDIFECNDGQARIASSEVKDRHRFVMADSRVFLRKLIDDGVKFDFIYIDGDHLYDAVASDLDCAAHLIQDGGVIILDDADPNHSHFGVYTAIEEFLVKNEWFKRELAGSTSSAVILMRK